MRAWRKSRAVGLAAALMVTASPAFSQVPVWDPETIARMAQQSAQAALALSHAVALVNQVNQLTRTVGRFGSLANMDFGRFDLVEGFQGAGPQISGTVAAVSSLRTARISSFDDAKAFVQTLTTVPAGSNQTTRAADARQDLEAMHRHALEGGYALAVHLRESVSAAPERAKILAGGASAPLDLRGDIGANTATSLAVLEQLVSLKAALAFALEIEASGLLRRMPPK